MKKNNRNSSQFEMNKVTRAQKKQKIVKKQQTSITVNNLEPIQFEMKDELQIEVQKINFICRICLQEGQALHAQTIQELTLLTSSLQTQPCPLLYLLSVCACSGTSGYTHQTCIAKWLTTKLDPLIHWPIYCQICLCEIIYETTMERKFMWGRINVQQVEDEKIMRFMRLGVWAVVWGVVFIITNARNQTNNVVGNFLLLIVSIILALLLITIIQILYDVLFAKFTKIIKVYTSDEIKLKRITIKQRIQYTEASKFQI